MQKLPFTPVKETELRQLLQDALYNPNDPPPDEVVIFRIEGQNIGSLGNFALLTGLPKAGKGKYVSGFTAAGLTREEIFSLQVKLQPGKNGISYWDTEQSRHDHFQMMATIKRLMNAEVFPAHFKSYHCRKHDAAIIISMVEFELSTNPNIGVVILDGLLDLIDSFNDEKQSKMLVNFLKRITDIYNVFVLGVLHRSKSVDKSMGHLGSAADRAAQSVLIVEKNKELRHYILRAEYLRNADDFTPISIYYNKQLNLWEQCETVNDQSTGKPQKPVPGRPADFDISHHMANCARIFNSKQVQSYDELVQSVKEIYGKGRNWAVECVKFLTQEQNLIFRTETGYTNIQQARLYVSA